MEPNQTDRSETNWRSYEEVAQHLLNQFAEYFGISCVEGKQVIHGHNTGTEWAIDAKAIAAGGAGFLIVECRRYTTTKQSQEKVGALAYRIQDTRAQGGIIVSPLGLQAGAQRVADAENVISIILNAESTTEEYILQFLTNVFVGEHLNLHDSIAIVLTNQDGNVIQTTSQ